MHRCSINGIILEPFRNSFIFFCKRGTLTVASSILNDGEDPEKVYLLIWAPDHFPRSEITLLVSVLRSLAMLVLTSHELQVQIQSLLHRLLLLP